MPLAVKPWSDDEITNLRTWWVDMEISSYEIARRLKRSKNSAVAKAHRLNLPARDSPIKPRAEGHRPRVQRVSRGASTLPPLASLTAS